MATPLLRFEDGRVIIGGKEILVTSASLSLKNNLAKERVYGDLDIETRGCKVDFLKYHPVNGVQGSLSITFMVSASLLGPNNVESFLELSMISTSAGAKKNISEKPINNNVVGRYKFDNMYLKAFGFEMKPFNLIRATATYDIYGTIHSTADRWLTLEDRDFGHSLKSFGSIKITGAEIDSIFSYGFQILSMKYNILVNRKAANRIRENENTGISKYSGGSVPYRVTVEKIEAQAEVTGSELIDDLNAYGDQQRGSQAESLQNSVINLFMYTMNGVKIGNFSLEGKIIGQQMNISEQNPAACQVNFHQVIR